MITLRIGPFWVDERKKFFWSKNFLRPEPGWPHNGKKIEKFFIADFCELDHLEILEKKFFFEKCKILQNFRKFWKIAYLWARFSPRRRRVGKNLMRRTGKEIFCRFRISNQIFGSIYGSRDIERSLDTTFAVFGQNLTFVDEYLLRKNCFWYAVFCRCSKTVWIIYIYNIKKFEKF